MPKWRKHTSRPIGQSPRARINEAIDRAPTRIAGRRAVGARTA